MNPNNVGKYPYQYDRYKLSKTQIANLSEEEFEQRHNELKIARSVYWCFYGNSPHKMYELEYIFMKEADKRERKAYKLNKVRVDLQPKI